MKRLIALAIAALAVSGCESPRARSCRALVLAADDCDAARASFPARVSAGVSPLQVAASRNASAARWVRSIEQPTPELRSYAAVLADAMERRADTFRRLDVTLQPIRLRPGDDRLAPVDPLAPFVPHVEVLELCGSSTAVFDTTGQPPRRRPKDCDDLVEAYGVCIATARTTASLGDHLARCVSALEAVSSTDPERNAAIRALVAAFRGLAPTAARVETPVDEAVATLRGLESIARDRSRADADAAHASARLREICAR